MSKLKVEDRVLLSGTVDIVCTGEDIYPYKVTLDEGEAVWLHAETKIRRLVKRKRQGQRRDQGCSFRHRRA